MILLISKSTQYYIQILWDRNLGGRAIAESPGNLYNLSEKINITKDTKKVFSIVATQMIPVLPKFNEMEFVKMIVLLLPYLNHYDYIYNFVVHNL